MRDSAETLLTRLSEAHRSPAEDADAGIIEARAPDFETLRTGYEDLFASCTIPAMHKGVVAWHRQVLLEFVERLDLPAPSFHPGLKERCFGIAQGRPKAELSLTHPDMMRGILRRDPATHFEQGESGREFHERVTGAIHDIAGRHRGARVLVITHGWVMDVITRHIRHLPYDAVLARRRRNGETLWIKVRPGVAIGASHENRSRAPA